MRRTSVVVLALVAMGLFATSGIARADSSLHIGTGLGTACEAGCAGDPNLIGTGGNFDVFRNSGGSGLSDVWLVLAVPGNTTDLGLSVLVNGTTTVSGTFDGAFNSGDVFTFLGLSGLNNSNNVSNLTAADGAIGVTATSWGIYVFDLGVGVGTQSGVGLSATGLPIGTFAFAYGTDTKGGLDGTPFTEAGLVTGGPVTVPEPGSLALLGTGLLSFAGILRRRFARI